MQNSSITVVKNSKLLILISKAPGALITQNTLCFLEPFYEEVQHDKVKMISMTLG